MGVENNISASTFPRQGAFLHRAVEVCFNYDASQLIGGIIVRDDAEEPGRCIIRLDDGRYVLATECQYSFNNRGASSVSEPAPASGLSLLNQLHAIAKNPDATWYMTSGQACALLEEIAAIRRVPRDPGQ